MIGCGESLIYNGTFIMGSNDDENYSEDGESPVRKVKISKNFWIDSCEVTNGQFLLYWSHMNEMNKNDVNNSNNNEFETKQTKQSKHTEAERYGWCMVFELALSKDRNCEDRIFAEIKLAVDKFIEQNLSLARSAEAPNIKNLLGFVYEKK